MGRDLGTYHVKLELADGRGFIVPWSTGARYTGGTACAHPLEGRRIAPPINSEYEVIDQIAYHYGRWGNGLLPDNLVQDYLSAYPGLARTADVYAMPPVQRITVIKPSGEEVVVWSAQSATRPQS